MKKRALEPLLRMALETFPVVLLNGARQVGKSTLALENFEHYLTFDDGELRLFAKDNPKGFLKSLTLPVCLDEVQKVPSLLEYIKMHSDTARVNGNFLLTGSSNVLDHKEAKDTLAGRLIELRLHPLSSKEKNDKPSQNVIAQLLSREVSLPKKDYADEVISHILNGGYPEILRLEGFQKELWFSSYVASYIERDARDLADIRDIDSFIRFVNVLASRSGTLLNKSNLSTAVGIKEITADNYLSIMNRIYQATLLKPYFANIGKQFTKSPKVFFNDTGVLCSLLKLGTKEKLLHSPYSGQVFETYVFGELQKHLSTLQASSALYHYRTKDKKEIDFIVEVEGSVLAIEVKQSSSIQKDDFKHIVDFQSKSPKPCLGVVLYNGERVMELEKDLLAVPLGVFL
ncbi:MAG: ATP-binding protein [Campylobacterales bacterium]|nr:ATP-binding protein [Campylobacterales bacterium]